MLQNPKVPVHAGRTSWTARSAKPVSLPYRQGMPNGTNQHNPLFYRTGRPCWTGQIRKIGFSTVMTRQGGRVRIEKRRKRMSIVGTSLSALKIPFGPPAFYSLLFLFSRGSYLLLFSFLFLLITMYTITSTAVAAMIPLTRTDSVLCFPSDPDWPEVFPHLRSG